MPILIRQAGREACRKADNTTTGTAIPLLIRQAGRKADNTTTGIAIPILIRHSTVRWFLPPRDLEFALKDSVMKNTLSISFSAR